MFHFIRYNTVNNNWLDWSKINLLKSCFSLKSLSHLSKRIWKCKSHAKFFCKNQKRLWELEAIGGLLFIFKIEWFEYFLKVFRSLLKSSSCQNSNIWRPIIKIIASVVSEPDKREMTCLPWHGADVFHWQPVTCMMWLDNESFYRLLCLFKGLRMSFGSQTEI